MKPIRWLGVAWLATVLAGAAPASAQNPAVNLTLDPAMIKGPATARVSIVEFSDYQ
jgi:protein-disulfide isomerase